MTKYRGLRLDGKGWVEGFYAQKMFDGYNVLSHAIIPFDGKMTYISVEIHPESLSISFGLTDKNGKEIFGSIPINGVMSKGGSVLKGNTKYTYAVMFVKGQFTVRVIEYELRNTSFNLYKWAEENKSSIEIIGNQYEQNE